MDRLVVCPDDNTVLALIDGRLDDAELARFDHHLDECDGCRALVAALARGNDPASGARIGRYLLIESIGRGAMGIVYAAYDPELDRRVALKLLRPDLTETDSASARARLLREGRAIAKLSHANVITVHDVGEHDGRVFIAMEYVAGVPLSEWLVRYRRSTAEVIELFVQAGAGLAAAHDAGIVHRDFKPANVLVGDDGRVKVGDFGLALPAAEVPGATRPATGAISAIDLTRTGWVVGTPVYMAPEVIDGGAADIRSDQYAFAVAVYEGLCGRRPFVASRWEELAAAKRTALTPAVLDRLPPPLRPILARALSPEPDRRYRSVRELCADLAGAIGVGPRRRAVAAAAAVLAGGLLLAGAAMLERGRSEASVCGDARDRLVGVWDASRREAARAAFASAGLAGADAVFERAARRLDDYADRWAAARIEVCEATHVRREQSAALLDLRMRCLDDRRHALGSLAAVLSSRPDQALVDGAVPAASGLPRLEACDDVDALTARVPPPDDPRLREKVDGALARLADAETLARAGRYADALAIARAVADTARPLGYRPLDARAALLIGTMHQQLGDYAASEATLAEAALAAAEGRDDETAARAWTLSVGVVGYLLGRHDEGLAAARMARAAVARARLETTLGPELDNMCGLVHDARGDWAEAKRLHERALRVREQTLGPDHLDVAQALDNLGAIPYERGEYGEAERIYSRALDIRRRALGDDHPDVAASLNGLGAVLDELGRAAESRRAYEDALRIWERSLGPQHPNVAAVLNNLGNLARETGDHAGAERYLSRALDIWKATVGDEHPDVASCLSGLGIARYHQGRLDEARDDFVRSLALREKLFGRPDHPKLCEALINLAVVERELGHGPAAEKLYERALAIAEASFGADHRLTAQALTGIGHALIDRGRAAQALPGLERALAIAEAGGVTARERADTELALARALWGDPARHDAAIQHARDAQRRIGETRPDDRLGHAIAAWLDSHGR